MCWYTQPPRESEADPDLGNDQIGTAHLFLHMMYRIQQVPALVAMDKP